MNFMGIKESGTDVTMDEKQRTLLRPNLYFGLIIYFLASLLFWMFLPTYGVSFSVWGQEGNGGIQTYQTEKLEGYYSVWEGIESTATEISLKGYAPGTQKLYFHIDAIDKICIGGLSVEFFGIPVQTISAQELYDDLYEWEDCDLSMQDGYLRYLRTDYDYDATPYFRLCISNPIPWYALAFYGAVLIIAAVVIAIPVFLLFSHLPHGWTWLFLLGMPFWSLFLGEWINESVFTIEAEAIAVNYLILFALYLLLYILFAHLWMGTLCGGMLTMAFYIGNYFVQEFRGKPLLPQDFLALNTAASVVSEYSLYLNFPMLLGVCVLILSVLAAKRAERDELPMRYKHKIVLGLLFPLIGGCVYPFFANMEINYWDSDLVYGCQTHGTAAFFIRFAEASIIREPDGYSQKALEEILETYSEPQTVDGIQPTRILMVMNESFADMRLSGTGYDVDVMPFWDRLVEEYTSGTLYVSVRGGGTCNTEFESITGNSLAFLPAGSTPFANLINQDVFSLGWYFSQQGYEVASLHMHLPQNWNRAKVYPRLGLEPFFSFASYDTEEMEFLRGDYISDSENYRCLIDLEEEMQGNRKFIFNVTLQNHGD